MKKKKLTTQIPPLSKTEPNLLAFETAQRTEIDRIVADICADVQKRGDTALVEYTNRFDGTSAQTIADLILTQDVLAGSVRAFAAGNSNRLETAAARVESYHQRQKMESWTYEDEDGTLWDNKLHRLTASAFTSLAAKRRIQVPSL